MSCKRRLFGGILIALIGILVGVLVTARLNLVNHAGTVDLVSPVKPAGFFQTESRLPSFVDLAKQVSLSVVNISTTKKIKRPPMPPGGRSPYGPGDPFDEFFDRFFQGPSERPQRSLGSGFVMDGEGHIITNNHVIEGADEIQVQLTDKRKFTAKIIGVDTKTDLAVIKIEAKNLPTATLGDSNSLNVGEWVLAVGNPFGLDHTVTAGIVSAKGRIIGAGPYDDFIQTDASINPGNSGGPLFNLEGKVVGVNTAIVAAGQGIGFAIPINMARDLVPQLIRSGKVTRAWLGVGIQEITPELAESFGLKDAKGGLVSNVFPNSPADKAGFQPGDIVIKFDGQEIQDSHDLSSSLGRWSRGRRRRRRRP
ncbi:MAG: trypsin-like peptidase domain-containing protein [Deltaproteobacteria bacterium]|nr:trypsin-like peptidase domain-containing protein [Deltaproteobacteria bacterium]